MCDGKYMGRINMPDGEYQDYSENELRELRRDFEKSRARSVAERNAYTKHFAASASNWVGTSEDYVGFTEVISNFSKRISAIDAEFSRRRADRGARREEREAREAQRNTGRGGGLVGVACSCHPPRRIKLTTRTLEGGPVICGVCHESFQSI
jgi:hypothetical protein